MNKAGTILTKIFHWVFFIVALFLFISAVLTTASHGYDEGVKIEFAGVGLNNPLVTILQIVLGIGIIYLFYRLTDRLKDSVRIDVIAGIVCVIALAVSIIWINLPNIVIGGDQQSCVTYADAMNAGDYSSMDRGQYLGTYQHLLGFVALLRVLFKLFGEGNYEAVRYFNALCVPLLIWSGYKITKYLSKDDRQTELFYLLVMLFATPMYVYVLFVYGDLSGSAFSMLSVWMFTEVLKNNKVRDYILLFLSCIVSTMMRSTGMIFVAAMLIVCVVKMIGHFDKKLIAPTLLLVAVLLSYSHIIALMYANVGVDTSKRLPPTATIAMGMNYDNGYAGWYNYYELDIHYENGCDYDTTNEAALEVLREVYIPLFIHDPAFTVKFFFEKLNSQWQEPLYQCFLMNDLLYGGQNDFVMSVYFGGLNTALEWIMKMVQIMMYGCTAFVLFKKRKDEADIEFYLTMIAVFGGFLLSMVWESKGRYILPYFFALVPVYAVGAGYLYNSLKTVFKKKGPADAAEA